MRAAWYQRNGEAGEVLVVGELPTPVPGPGEVRVKIHASGVNPSDVKGRRGRPLGAYGLIVPHSDGAGVVDAVGAGVARHRTGDRVWIWNGQWKRQYGTAADYIVLPQEQAQPLPATVGFEGGACMGIPVLTALHAVALLGEISSKTILVTGGGSGVGYYVTQVASRVGGASVIATAGSDARRNLATAAGAAAVIDYKAQAVPEAIRSLTGGKGVDAIVDLDFSGTASLLDHDILTPHGTIVVYGSNAATAVLPMRRMTLDSLKICAFLVYELLPDQRAAVLAATARLLSEGRLDHAIGARFPLDDIASAHMAVESGRVAGKVCVMVAS